MDMIVSLLMKWFCGTKFVMQFQYQFFSLPPIVPVWRRIVFKKVAVFLGRRADNIRCVTREIREMARLEGVPEWTLRVIPARCDVEMFRPNREIRKQTRLSLSIQNKKVIIYLGSLLVLKGVCVEDHNVSWSSSGSYLTKRPRPSMGAADMRGTSYVPRTMRSALAKDASKSPPASMHPHYHVASQALVDGR